MAFDFEQGKDQLIKKILNKAKEQEASHPQLQEFLRQFYGTVALEDLQHWDVQELLVMGLHFFTLMQHRQPKDTKINIYNPQTELSGWNRSGTVIEIILEDMPFLVDSVRMVLDRMGLCAQLIIHTGGIQLERNAQHELLSILPKNLSALEVSQQVEAPIWVLLEQTVDSLGVEELKRHLLQALEDDRAATEDWTCMRGQLHEVMNELERASPHVTEDLLQESKAFLNWLDDHHFTFLGLCDYQLIPASKQLRAQEDSGLGILRPALLKERGLNLDQFLPSRSILASTHDLLIMSKANTLATVHRNAYCDYIAIKRFNAEGQMIGERRIIGLYTAAAYNSNPKHIPFLRHKVAQVMKNSELSPKGHAGKVLLNILETIPRDDLIQASEEELLALGMGIFHLQERRRIRLFARTDIYQQFISCLVYVPKERYTTELRQAMQQVLAKAFHSQDITFSTRFSESVLARVHFLVRLPSTSLKTARDFKAIEQELIDVGRSWIDELQQQLEQHYPQEQAAGLFHNYQHVFPMAYCENFSPQDAVVDVQSLEALKSGHQILIRFAQDTALNDTYRLKIYQKEVTVPLSEVLPIIENLGLRAVNERPYCLHFANGSQAWISDFVLSYQQTRDLDIEQIQDVLQIAFTKAWLRETENDGFNQLILAAQLDWRSINIVRAYAKYFKQICFTFSQDYIEATLVRHASITQLCVKLFETRFNPDLSLSLEERHQAAQKIVNHIEKELNQVTNLDEDKIIRHYVHAIHATLRTNFYQIDDQGEYKKHLAFKLNCSLIPGMPKPYPKFEIFVYSPRVEGVHLRGSHVARGGLRWSDRREDFRTEVLGLMKAQQVKNAIIVPNGAKGGFYPKQSPTHLGREAIWEEGVACYRIFISSLLDVTDNYQGAAIIAPERVICYDEPDPYLVVAADKGTATFSDYANAIALERQFWLGDAFASGGSVGYDHKKMGITAQGAWESVKRHFYEMNIPYGQVEFTAIGIGDMAGDVFGNGMLLSRHLKLIAAFNHAHIFIDPNPDAAQSFSERERMFHLPRSSWADYDASKISQGGGVFERSLKSIPVSAEMKQVFGIKKHDIEPNELIRMILTAPVDLLWSGGIGTFVKAQTETHAEVGDRTNDLIRVNAHELRCKMIGEGGNLGLTQKARIEYNLHGGRVFTDFIDNSAGVNCSDKEVNIKILLNRCISKGELTLDARNHLLASMTHEVSDLVLQDNIQQTRSISLVASQTSSVDLYVRYIHSLEQSGKLDRSIEHIPEDKTLIEHKLAGRGMSLPVLSVLQCYSKNLLKDALLASDLLEDPYLDQYLVDSFPKKLKTDFTPAMMTHPLRREIIATKLANIMINEMGLAFVYRVVDETMVPEEQVVRAYLIVRHLLSLGELIEHIEKHQSRLSAEHEKTILMLYVRLVRRMVRWVIKYVKAEPIAETLARYETLFYQLKKSLPKVLSTKTLQKQKALVQSYEHWGLPKELAYELSITRQLFSAFDLVEIASKLNKEIESVAKIYFDLGDELEITWLRSQVIAHPTDSRWEALSREAIRDDLDAEQRFLTESYFKHAREDESSIKHWLKAHHLGVQRWHQMMTDLKSNAPMTYTMYFVAIRQLMNITQSSDLKEV